MKAFNLLTDVPFINNRDELKQWLQPVYIISDHMKNFDDYKIFQSKMYNIIKGCFVIRECREYPIKFKFYKTDKKTHTLEFRHFIINLIVWYPFIELSDIDVIDESFILDCNIDIPKIEKYINTKLITVLQDYHIKSDKINYAISEVLYNLRKISEDFSIILGLNISTALFIEMYEQYPEFKEIMECTFDENLQPHEIEQKLQELQDRELDFLTSIKDNPLSVILRSGTGIKHKQLAEFTISEGLKPTLDGKTIPIPIENSTMLKGLDRPSYVFIDALGARKSLVMNKKVMGKAGYFGKIVLLLARTLSLSTTVSDCDTKHLVTYEITNKKVLDKLNGKYFRESEDEPVKMLYSKERRDLIGKSIQVRSAATCACGENTVCAKCVGLTAVINADISDGIAAFESEEVTKVVNQSILSTKHLLTTNSEVIEFSTSFYDFFTIIGGEINPIVNDNQHVDDINDYGIYIDPEDLKKLEEMDDDSTFNTVIYDGRFYIRNLEDPSKDDILIELKDGKEIFVTEEAMALRKKGKGVIRFKDLDDDIKLFEVVIMNNELTKPLYLLMELLNKDTKTEDDIDETIDSMCNKFLGLLIESKIDANVIAAEFIINRLIRSAYDIYRRPDFSKEELEPYTINTVSRCLEKNKSPMVGLSFENFKRQFLSDALYEERNGTSYLDNFFKTQISTKNLKHYGQIMSNMKEGDLGCMK